MALPRRGVEHTVAQTQQLNRIAIAAGIPGVLNVVAPHRHRHTAALQQPQGRQGTLRQVVLPLAAQQPKVGGGQADHTHVCGSQPLRQLPLSGEWQQAQAAGSCNSARKALRS